MAILKFDTEKEWLEFRKQNITSTETAALFGLSEYKSRLKLWHIKNGTIEEDDLSDNPFVKWGRRLQSVVGRGICEDEGWEGEDLTGFFLHDEASRIGASLDFKATCADEGPGILETKTTGFFGEASGYDKDRAPIDNEFQVATQLHLASKDAPEIKWARIGVLSGRKETRLYRRVHDPKFGAMLEEEAAKFWRSIELNEPPAPDYKVDADLLAKLRGPIKEGFVETFNGNNRFAALIAEWEIANEAAKDYSSMVDPHVERKKEIQAEIHDLMGDAEVAIIGDYRISARLQTVEERIAPEFSFRRFDVKKRKPKK